MSGPVRTRSAIIVLALSFFLAFSTPCGLDIDGHGNMGDETMTVALASHLPFGPLAAYGYRPNGQEWTWGVNTAPLYGVFYGPFVHLVPTLKRIEAARLVSRVLGGVAIYLLAVALFQIIWRRPFSDVSPGIQLAVVSVMAFVFLNSLRFRFIASFARVDMLGFVFLAAVVAAGSWLLLAPGAIRVFVFTLVSLSTAWTSYVAFYLVGFIAAASLFFLACATQQRESVGRALRSFLNIVALPVAAAALIFFVLNAFFHGAVLSGPAGGALSAITNSVFASTHSPFVLEALGRPERWQFLGAGIVGLACVSCVAFSQSGAQVESPRRWCLLRLGVALVVLAAVYRVWMVMLGSLPIRFTYDVMITTAFGFLQLMVCCYLLRSWQAGRVVMGVAITGMLFYITVSTGLASSCPEDLPGTPRKLWPARRSLVGFYNPFDNSRSPGNQARELHASALREFLVSHGARVALATDPMLAAMSDQALTFQFLNDSGASMPSPDAEEMLSADVGRLKDIRYMVSSNFGEGKTLEGAGFAALRRCLRGRGDAQMIECRFGTVDARFIRVFSTDEVVASPPHYIYGTDWSTPLIVYEMTFEKAGAPVPSR